MVSVEPMAQTGPEELVVVPLEEQPIPRVRPEVTAAEVQVAQVARVQDQPEEPEGRVPTTRAAVMAEVVQVVAIVRADVAQPGEFLLPIIPL